MQDLIAFQNQDKLNLSVLETNISSNRYPWEENLKKIIKFLNYFSIIKKKSCDQKKS